MEKDKNLFGVKVAGLDSECSRYKNNPERYSEACEKINAGLLDTLGIEIAEKEELSNIVDADKLRRYLEKLLPFRFRLDTQEKIKDPLIKEKYTFLNNYKLWLNDKGNNLYRAWIHLKYVLPKSEAKKLIRYAIELAEYIWRQSNYWVWSTFREPLRGEFDEYIPDYLAWWTNYADNLIQKIKDRKLKEKDWNKMHDQIDKYGSVLPNTNRRNRSFWSGRGDVILSLTTGKIYDLEGNWEEELEKDYQSSRYYSSRSWASAAGTFISGKKTMVYLPTSRTDTARPDFEVNFGDVNGLKMTMLTYRWVIDESLPTVIWNVAWVDAVFLSQKNHLENGSAKNLVDAIQTKWKSLNKLPTRYFKTKYFDENLEEKELVIPYKSDMEDKDINFKFLGKYYLGIERWFSVKQTWSFIDRKAWIRKHNDKYVRLGTFWLIKEILDQHPSQLNREIEARWDTIEEKDSEYKKINWWTILDGFAYKSWEQDWYYRDLEEIFNDHKDHNFAKEDFGYDHGFKLFPTQYLIIEKKLKDLYKERFSKLNINMDESESMMEYEYNVPKVLFDKFPLSYRQDFMHKKLVKKAMESLNIYRMPLEQQKNIVKDYLKIHKNDVFTLQDSYDVWNCRPESIRFAEVFNLKWNDGEVKITWEELLNHKHFEKMLSNRDFRKIFVNKFAQEISDLEPMDNNDLEAPVVNLEDDSKEEIPPKTRKTRARKIARKED